MSEPEVIMEALHVCKSYPASDGRWLRRMRMSHCSW